MDIQRTFYAFIFLIISSSVRFTVCRSTQRRILLMVISRYLYSYVKIQLRHQCFPNLLRELFSNQ